MAFSYYGDILISGTGTSVTALTGVPNSQADGANLTLSGFVYWDIAYALGHLLFIDFLDSNSNVLFTRQYPAGSIGGGSSFASVFGIIAGYVETGSSVVIPKIRSIRLRHSTGASASFDGVIHVNAWVGQQIPDRITVDHNNPPVEIEWQPSFTAVGTAIDGSGNITVPAGTFLVSVDGTPTSGRFNCWLIDLAIENAVSADYLDTIRLTLYLSNGLTTRVEPQRAYLASGLIGRYMMIFSELTSAMPTYLDIQAVASSAGLASAIQAATKEITVSIQPFNYERL